MGLFSIFGEKKTKEYSPGQLEEDMKLAREKEIQAVKDAHANLPWPVIPKLNQVSLKDDNNGGIRETVSPERKDEIGPMIFEDDISINELMKLTNQELLFVLTAFDEFNEADPIPDYERNRRKVYNEIIRRIRDSKLLYVIYDKTTGYPFIDHGNGLLYFEKELAEDAAKLYEKQYRQVLVKEIQVEIPSEANDNKKGYFDFLYSIGFNDLMIDNGAYRVKFRRNEIVADPGDWNGKKDVTPINPKLCFAMLDMLEERRWPVKYAKRDEVLGEKERRMLGNLYNGKYIIPMQYEGPVETAENGKMRLGKDTKFSFFMIKTQDNKLFLPIFTDGFEFGKMKLGPDWNAAVFTFSDVARFIADKDGIAINPAGHKVFMPKEQVLVIDGANRAYTATKLQQKNKNENAVDRAVNGAMAKIDG